MENEIAYKCNDQIIDTQSIDNPSNETKILFDNSEESLEIIRHSCAHLLAQAIKELYPEAKFFVGPVIEDGFYYDFKVDSQIGDSDLKDISKKMKQLVKKKDKITKHTMNRAQALEKFKDDELKLAVISKIEGDEFSFYKQGNFEDLCHGPHLPSTRYLNFFKLTKVSGAYLGGDEKNEMLTRIYGTAFATKEALKEHIDLIEEAKKRDHRKIGRELDLFAFDEEIGAGLPIWLPNGARLRSKLENILFRAHRRRGYEPVRGPEILKSDAWKVSGHYDNYGENMYFTDIDDMQYGLKPMNCVGHIKVYQHDVVSYKDLPLKFFEYGVVHRHEKSGVMHGLFRVREFTQDDAHIFCETDQIKENVIEILGFVDNIMKVFGFEYNMAISTKPQKAIGDDAIWDKATGAIKEALDENNLEYDIDEGGGAFYGPKIDIQITDALKRKWQCGTIQIDFNLPQRFNLTYINKENEKSTPVMIHRAILGSFERFIGILTEHCGGEFPTFIAPNVAIIVPISEVHHEYAYKLKKQFALNDIDVVVSDKNDSLNKRIRLAEKQKVPFVLIVGDEEVNENKVAIRDRRQRSQYSLSIDEFIELIKKQNEVNF